jgi:ATP-binding cassette subfamily B protein
LHSKVACSLRSKFVTLYAQLPYLPQAASLVWQAARKWTIAWAVMLVLQGLLPVATVYLTRTLVDSLLQNGLTLIAMAGVLIPFGWWVPLVLLLSALPALVVVVHYTLRQNQWRLRA